MADRDVEAIIRRALDRLAGDLPALGIALSGGGDSVALMQIIARWADGRRIMAATVDHALRAGSDAEAEAAGAAAAALGIAHQILRWDRPPPSGDGGKPTGNLMAQARDARLRLMAGWAQENDLPAVALGHSRDDQAETVVMRLLRGSGVDGMAGMADWRDAFGVRWLRPMLGVGRDELRDWLTTKDIGWIDDPSNANPEFDRIRIRRTLSELDVDRSALAMVAANLTEVRATLAHYAAEVAHEAVADRGRLTLPRGPFRRAPAEIQRRILIAAARWVTGADYPPRRATVLHALRALDAGSRVTLDGTIISPDGDRLQITREPAAALRAPRSAGPVWDNRWRVEGLEPGQLIGALGDEALADLSWRLSGLPRDDAAASPAIRDAEGNLVAAPLIRAHPGITCLPLRNTEEFRRLIRHG